MSLTESAGVGDVGASGIESRRTACGICFCQRLIEVGWYREVGVSSLVPLQKRLEVSVGDNLETSEIFGAVRLGHATCQSFKNVHAV